MIGRRIGLVGSARSMITTWAVSATFSLTQMNLSDSMVRVAKPICCTLMPMFWSCWCAKRMAGERGRGAGGERSEPEVRVRQRREKDENRVEKRQYNSSLVKLWRRLQLANL